MQPCQGKRARSGDQEADSVSGTVGAIAWPQALEQEIGETKKMTARNTENDLDRTHAAILTQPDAIQKVVYRVDTVTSHGKDSPTGAHTITISSRTHTHFMDKKRSIEEKAKRLDSRSR